MNPHPPPHPTPPVGLALVGALAATFWRAPLEDLIYSDLGEAVDGLLTGTTASGLGAGDVAGALLWGVALWFVTPLQLLLLFLGKIETERPSDGVIKLVGRAAGLRCVSQCVCVRVDGGGGVGEWVWGRL